MWNPYYRYPCLRSWCPDNGWGWWHSAQSNLVASQVQAINQSIVNSGTQIGVSQTANPVQTMSLGRRARRILGL